MADESELQTLARRYLDLWESQLSAMASDSELAEQLGRLFAATNASLLSSVQAAGGPQAEQGRADAGANTPGSDRTATPAAARGDRVMDMAELERRLAALERRLDAIERRQSTSD
jgi:ubiquinone biosynthesis protein UbiJ